ncbi:MAG: hypothetical protein AAFY76_06510 [Cyanobacteria bacterium J06649_11]
MPCRGRFDETVHQFLTVIIVKAKDQVSNRIQIVQMAARLLFEPSALAVDDYAKNTRAVPKFQQLGAL